ncbi:MAG: serine/threonine protein kinase [Myxococcaceae bacterium]|nr:serine/threonine protein kinase [Myxococcaceae bacterium]
MSETYGNYELLERIATGGMAEIFRAKQLGLEGFEKELCIKRILPHLAREPQFIKMFLDEARIAARLSHPNITQIYNLGAQGGTYFIAMEYVDGRDLREIWRMCEARGQPMPPQYACRIVAEACAALHHAHKKTNKQGKPLGIVHRDVSPQNILVTHTGDVKVVDFGIAKAADSSTHTRAGVLKGKFAYMSPEQAQGTRIDRRTDIFALGVILHELITGVRLFKRDTDVSTLTAVGNCHVDPPGDSAEGVDDELDDIVLKALAKNPKDRFQDCEEMQLALERWLVEKSLPSSSAALAQFLSQLGKDIEKAANERKRKSTKSSSKAKPREPTKLIRSGEYEEPEEEEIDEPLSQPKPMPKRREPTQAAPPPGSEKKQKTSTSVFAFLFGVTLVALLAVLGVQFLRPTAAAVVKVTSQPSGANVYWNGEPLKDKTPLTLPPAGAGSYWLEVSVDGYEAYRAKVEVPASGERDLTVVLRPAK